MSDLRRVALIRGRDLNPYDAQQYFARRGDVEMVAVGARDGRYELQGLPMPIRRLRSVGAELPGPLRRRPKLFAGWGTRFDELEGLERAVADCSILHVAETFIATSAQAARIRQRDVSDTRLVVTVWENIAFRHDDDGAMSARKGLVRAATDLFVAVTEGARLALLAEGVHPSRIQVRPPGVDLGRFNPGQARKSLLVQLGLPDRARSILYVGRLIAEKGVIDLIRALPSLDPDVHLLCVGSGPEVGRLHVAARSLNVSERVHVGHSVPYSRVPAVMAAADVIAVPSMTTPYWSEQFGMVLIEAMACGTPVVATASGAIPEVLGEAGLLSESGDVAALATNLALVLNDPRCASALQDAGLWRVKDRFNAEATRSWWAEQYALLRGDS